MSNVFGPQGFAELESNILRAKKFPTGGKHPLKKVPGFPKYASWDPYLGRWVIYRMSGTRVTK